MTSPSDPKANTINVCAVPRERLDFAVEHGRHLAPLYEAARDFAREPDLVDRRPHQQPRRLGEITKQIVDETGEKSLRRWPDEAAQAETQEERRAALATAQKIAQKLGVPLADFIFGRAA